MALHAHRPAPSWLRITGSVGLVLLFVVLFVNSRSLTSIGFAWSPLDDVVRLGIGLLPVAAFLCMPRTSRRVHRVAIVVLLTLVLASTVVFLRGLVYLPLTLQSGYSAGEAPVNTTRIGRDRIVVYRAPGFMTFVKNGAGVRQERDLAPGLVLKRELYYDEPAEGGRVQIIGTDSLQVTVWSDPHRPEAARVSVLAYSPL